MHTADRAMQPTVRGEEWQDERGHLGNGRPGVERAGMSGWRSWDYGVWSQADLSILRRRHRDSEGRERSPLGSITPPTAQTGGRTPPGWA